MIALHGTFLLALRALPHTPGHDGVRLFLPAFGVLALLAGRGALSLLAKWGGFGKLAIIAALIEAGATNGVMMPVPLSYFSPLVGGLPGAARLGMEPTYYWDALTPDVRKWLTDHTGPDETIAFATFPHSWLYLRHVGALPARLAAVDPGQPRWYVLQNRPGAFSDGDRLLVREGRPAHVESKLGTPLLWIFPYSELARVVRDRVR